MTKIDDAAVDRARKHLTVEVRGYAWDRGHRGEYNEAFTPSRKQIREALEAALSPEPEIPVSDPDLSKPGRNQDTWQVENILLAILSHLKAESARRKEAGQGPERRSGKDRRRPSWSEIRTRLDEPPPWLLRGDKGRSNRGRRKTDQ